ncbi:MAG: hypothetical protein ACXWI7_02890 [Croceibacterium sp.]
MIIDIILALFVVISLAACIVGGPPERFLGVMFLVWIPFDKIFHSLYGLATYLRVDWFLVSTDTTAFVLLLGLALRANRFWPIVCAAGQCVAVGGHLAALLLGVIKAPYWAMTQFSPYVQIVALAAGTWAHWRRNRRIGPYRSWRRA